MATKAKSPVTRVAPKTMGEMIDHILELQEEHKMLQTVADEQEERVKAAIKQLEENFDQAKIDGAKGSLATAERKPQDVYSVEDWPKVYAYILKHKAFELLHKRITAAAVKERAEAGEAVPGVAKTEIYRTVVKAIKVKA